MKKLRNTAQREAVYEAVVQLNPTHPTADEVYALLQQNHPTISRGTVYRNLNVLCETGRLRKLGVGEGPDRFDDQIQWHGHFYCRHCHRMGDLPLPEHMIVEYLSDLGYEVESQTIVFKGTCPNCRKVEVKQDERIKGNKN